MILISGATGKVGSAACEVLHKAGVSIRILVRNPEKLSLKPSEALEVMTGDLADEGAVTRAMEGIEKALLVMGNNPEQANIEQQFATIAAQSGVQHLVKISSMEAGPDAKAVLPKQHFASEQHIRSLGIDWTFLRPNFYLQNMLMYAGSIANTGHFALPLGNARVAPVDTRDIGKAAAKILQEDGHTGATYALTGKTLLSFADIAAEMSIALGKPVEYVAQTAAEFRNVLANFVKSEWQLNAVCELFDEIANGSLEKTSTDLKSILGREPVGVGQFVADHTGVFRG